MSFSHLFVDRVGHYADRWRIMRASARIRRLIDALPPHIRKDIGWPDTPLAEFVRRDGEGPSRS
ncbi:hypothetical protein [Nitratireductor alexandrii]|uniref:hypothetical protein n=1 Tax=Nitratireductor alexandrii TaxID=2448161 RepID=UPI000FDBA79F|nr:hypothetical protein [Nitratireductor alexandrii]